MSSKCLYEITFDIKGPAGEVENIPNNTNPVACVNMASLLNQLCKNLPTQSMGQELEVMKVVVKKVGECNE